MEFKNDITNMSLDDYIAMSNKFNNGRDGAANKPKRSNNDITNMSLDDYIAMSKLNNVCDGAAAKLNGCNYFKFGRRKQSNEAEEEEEDDEEQVHKIEGQDIENDVDMEIWKGPDASVAYIDCHDQNNDLRNKVTPSSTYRHRYIENASKAIRSNPNNTFDYSRGTPTILPCNTQQQRHGGFQRGNHRYRNHRFNNYYYGSNHNNSSGNYMHMNPNNYKYQNNIGIGGLRTQRNTNQNLRMNTGNGNNDNKLREAQSPRTSKNLIIQVPSNAIKLGQGNQFKSCFRVPNADNENMKAMPVGSLTSQAEAALNLNESPNTASNSSNQNLKSLLGFQGNVSGDMMPLFASRLLEFLQNGTQPQVHKPVYDTKIQQEIHELQNKPMLYKCNDGEVISSDGAGINCKIIPRATGVPLNYRFA